MVPVCKKLGVAAITYKALSKTNLSKVTNQEFQRLSRALSASRKVSLRRVVFEINGGDIIYIKEGKNIIAKGTVQGPKRRAYRFDSSSRIIDENGVAWPHQVPVSWDDSWKSVVMTVGKSQRYAVEELSDEDVARLFTTISSSPEPKNRVGTYLARVCWNSRNWIQPSGDAAESEAKGTYASENGFGNEEWLFNFQWTLAGWKFGFLQPINKSYSKLKGTVIDLRLFAITGDGQRQYVGEISSCYVLTKDEAANALKRFRKNGWLKQMQQQVRAIKGDPSALRCSPLELFNIRFKPEHAEQYDPPVPVLRGDYVSKINRYMLVSLNGSGSNVDKQWRRRVEATKDRPTGKQKRSGTGATNVDLVHNALQNELAALLRAKYGQRIVHVENDFVDIQLRFKKRAVFIEIKSDPRPLHAVREALGQLLQYDFIANENGAAPTELVVVGPGSIDQQQRDFVNHLRKQWNIPITYVCFRSGMKKDELAI